MMMATCRRGNGSFRLALPVCVLLAFALARLIAGVLPVAQKEILTCPAPPSNSDMKIYSTATAQASMEKQLKKRGNLNQA